MPASSPRTPEPQLWRFTRPDGSTEIVSLATMRGRIYALASNRDALRWLHRKGLTLADVKAMYVAIPGTEA